MRLAGGVPRNPRTASADGLYPIAQLEQEGRARRHMDADLLLASNHESLSRSRHLFRLHLRSRLLSLTSPRRDHARRAKRREER